MALKSHANEPAHTDVLATLKVELEKLRTDIQAATAKEDLRAVQGLTAFALLRMHETLAPLMGFDALWPLAQAAEIISEARKGSRHHLVTLSTDKPHLPQSAPGRQACKAMAAAALTYFKEHLSQLDLNQEDAAQKIANAMAAGGFAVRPGANRELDRGPSARAVQQWCNDFSPRLNRKKPAAFEQAAYDHTLQALRAGRGNKSYSAYVPEILASITAECRVAAPLFAPLNGRKS